MTQLPERLQIGSNKPPSDIELLEDRLTTQYVHLMRRAEAGEALGSKIPPQFSEQLEADFVIGFIKDAKEIQESLESARKNEKEPFLRQGQMVDTFFKQYVSKLEEGIEKAKSPLEVWLKKCAAEEKIKRDAEAEKLKTAAISVTHADMEQATQAHLAAAVAQKAAAAPVHTMAATGGAKLKKEWVGTIADIKQVDLEKLRAYIKPEALQVALNAYVKMGGRECGGCEIKEQVKVGVR